MRIFVSWWFEALLSRRRQAQRAQFATKRVPNEDFRLLVVEGEDSAMGAHPSAWPEQNRRLRPPGGEKTIGEL